MTLKNGTKVDDFNLKDQFDTKLSLTDLKGKRVLLSFHPLAFTGICSNQMLELDNRHEELDKLNTVPLGVSIDSVPAKKAWAEKLGIEKLRMLADFWPHGGLAKKLDVFINEKGFSQRANILLDETGKVIWTKVYKTSELPALDEVIDHIKQLD